jgi:hypothetical protein
VFSEPDAPLVFWPDEVRRDLSDSLGADPVELPVEGALAPPELLDGFGAELQAAVIIARMAMAEITPVRPDRNRMVASLGLVDWKPLRDAQVEIGRRRQDHCRLRAR